MPVSTQRGKSTHRDIISLQSPLQSRDSQYNPPIIKGESNAHTTTPLRKSEVHFWKFVAPTELEVLAEYDFPKSDRKPP